MENVGVSDPEKKIVSEAEMINYYPVVFGVSCAFAAMDFMSNSECVDEKWLVVRNSVLQGSANLLGLLVWRIQKEEAKNGKFDIFLKLKNVEREMEELKKQRSEDAKANEKVVGIFAAKEQGWFSERKKLRQQLGGLMNDLRVVQSQKDKVISQLNEKLKGNDILIQWKDDFLKKEQQMRGESEEQLKKAGNIVEEMRECFNNESRRHSSEIIKHKTVFIELVSNQRQLEAEVSRVNKQFEAAKQELDSVLEQKEESVMMTHKLSAELIKMNKELEQKDQILSAMLRKSRVDIKEKEMLLKEVKLSKAKRKQTKQETERLTMISAAKHNMLSLRGILSKHSGFKLDASSDEKGANTTKLMVSYPETTESFSTTSDEYLTTRNEETTNTEQYLERWVQCESERNNVASEQRHTLEIDAFAEQLILKNEKLEVFHWRYMSMELELKRMQSRVEGLNHDIVQLRQDNMELEALLLNREEELRLMREQMTLRWSPPNFQTTNLKSSSLHDPSLVPDIVWSKVKIIKKKHELKEQGAKITNKEIYHQVETNEDEVPVIHQANDIVLTLLSPDMKKTEESKAPRLAPNNCAESHDVKNAQSTSSAGQSESKDVSSLWKMDLHALGVSFKIKRLKQQLAMLERLTGKKGNSETSERNDNQLLGQKTFYALLSLLNKHVGRYQLLQSKIDDICKSMHDHDPSSKHKSSKIAKTNQETKLLGHFLEETFQLQRYIVATGQKLMEVQGKITAGFLTSLEVMDCPTSFNVKRYADGIRNMFSEVQRGLEVRIARIIGDLEGTLASDGIVHMRKQKP